MKRYLHLLCAIVVGYLSIATTVHAQTPDRSFGIGFAVSSATGGGGTVSAHHGMHFVYAVTPGFHLGVSTMFSSLTAGEFDQTLLMFRPFLKFLLSGNKDFKPYIGATFTHGRLNSPIFADFGTTQEINALGGTFGGQYFPSPNIGVFGQISFLEIGVGDSEYTEIGIMQPSIGIEWFFR